MLNQKGQSLIGVLVAVAISGIVMMMVVDLNTVMVKNNTTAQANSDVLAYINSIRSNMQSPDLITKMLAGNSISGPVIIKDPLVTGSVMGQAGYRQQPSAAWVVQSVSFENVTPTDVADVKRLTLVVQIQKDASRTIGGISARRIVGDVYCKVTGTVIVSCSLSQPETPPVASNPIKDDQEFKRGCSAIGGEMSNGVCTFHSRDNSPCNDDKS